MPITLGLISDTHMPDRWTALPPAVFDAFDGVDLILHAGDVGDLWVLDQLSRAAPVVAVLGNDELSEATIRTLPVQQVIHAGGRRILLMHGHHPDRAEEMRSRKQDAWSPKLSRWADLGRQAGASVVIYGHTHVALAVEVGDVWVINPGAVASGSYLTRQHVQTVARLTLHDDGPPAVEFVDLNAPGRPLARAVDLDSGFRAALHAVSASIAAPDLEAARGWFFEHVYPLAEGPIRDALRRLMFRCIQGEQARYGVADVLAELEHTPGLPPEVLAQIKARADRGKTPG